jgi:hypothetical protein
MFIVLGVPNQEEVKESGQEKRKERRKIYTPLVGLSRSKSVV